MQTPVPTSTVLYAGVDWLTATTPPGARGDMMDALSRLQVGREINAGDEARDWIWQGYVGQATRAFAYGRRHDGHIVRMSGDLARTAWREFARLAVNIPRIDVQATVRLNEPTFQLGRYHRAEAIAFRNTRGAPAAVTAIDEYRGGYTLYIGKRASDTLTRIYDKSEQDRAEQLEQGTWRYEVEYKRAQALAVGRMLLGQGDERRAVVALLHRHLTRRGVRPLFTPTATVPEVDITRYTDTDSRLRWLESSVAPAVAWLCQRGQEHNVRTILGLR